VFNNIALRLNAALAGCGLAFLPEDEVQTHLGDGRLGVRRFQAITSITRAAGNPRRHSPCWSMRCATGLRRQFLRPSPSISHSTSINHLRRRFRRHQPAAPRNFEHASAVCICNSDRVLNPVRPPSY
jgi:hypothetical protein